MQKVVSSEEMREIDRLTTEKYGIPSILLMENAAQAAARVIAAQLGGSLEDRSILVLCGKGNNGGDGAALARILWQQGADVEACLFGLVEDTKDEARVNFEILKKITEAECFELSQTDLAFEEILGLEEWLEYEAFNFQGDNPDVIVDALFGTGVSRPLDGVFEQVAAFIDSFADEEVEERQTMVVSLDVPSGLNADKCEPIGACPRADLTVTFTAPKLANVLPPAADRNGELYVAKIGSPCDLVDNSASQTYLAEPQDVAFWLAKSEFADDSYKNRRGHLLLIAGSANYSGAAVLAGNAAMRSGVGLVTIATPNSSATSIAARVAPEVMVRGVAEDGSGAVSEEAKAEIDKFSDNIDAIAIGCGLSTSDETKNFVKKVVDDRQKPIVIDADGLTALAPFQITGSDEFPLILTPHEGEFLKLLGTDDKEILKDRVEVCRDFAQKHNVILVLKGPRAMVAAPDGMVVVIPVGNSGLGKAGNGDTLTGVIAGFAAQAARMQLSIFEAVVAAAFICGYAGDLAEADFGKRVMTASDVRDYLAEAFSDFNG
jgi:hydroxyethylthiazole kinase-like uncharacterized protein yjeF